MPTTEVPLGATLGSGEDRFVNRVVNPSLLPWPVTVPPVAGGEGNGQNCLGALRGGALGF